MREPTIRTAFTFTAVALSLAALSTTSDASTSIAMTVDELAQTAQVVARVTPIESHSAWQGGRIVTTTRVRVDAVLAGEGPSEVVVQSLGGSVDGIAQRVEGEPTLAAGAPAILFLARSGDTMRVVGRAQGRWLVTNDHAAAVVRIRDTGALVARRVRGPVAPRGTLATQLDGASLDEATRAIGQAWRSTHAL